MKRLIIISIVIGTSWSVNAQIVRGPINAPSLYGGGAGVQDGAYLKEQIPTKKVVPYENLREADVVWSKRVWRTIDLRQKINHPLFFPMDDIQEDMRNRNSSVWSLWTMIRLHVMRGDLTLYSPFNPNWESWKDGDGFKYPITGSQPGGNFYNDSIFRERVFMYLGEELIDPFPIAIQSNEFPGVDSTIMNEQGYLQTVYPPNDTLWYTSSDIIAYRLKEDWFFDKQTSRRQVRIIGIAPVIHQRDVNGNITGERELFWLYFPECRYVFQNYYIKNRHNDAQWMSVDDLFHKRIFNSYIIKSSNLYDRQVADYAAGVDALLESEKIEEELTSMELDLWSY